jgi:3D (Asp-Asp-Asp) domain-containing protein
MCLGLRFKVLTTTLVILLLSMTTVLAAGFLVKQGMQGDNVRQVQQLLTDQGYSLGSIDGVCGQATVKAIKKFQADNGLIVDGIVGEDTYQHLAHERQETSRGGMSRSMYMDASAYSAFDPGNGNRTATGRLLKKGIVAVDPDVIPLGTKLYIPGYGDALAGDVGSSIRGNKIDMAFDTHEEAISFGRQNVIVYIVE